MGTRSLTTFIETWKDEKTGKTKQNKIVTMYRQYDGYPKGHGMELAEFLRRGELVNGIPFGKEGVIFNGMGCLAAQCVAHFKDGPGGIYLHKGGTTNCWEEYHYEVVQHEGSKDIVLRCYDMHNKKWIFEGKASEFVEKIEEIEAATN